MVKSGRTTGGRIYRMFSGKKFLLTLQVGNKTDANAYANGYRKEGWLVRVTKHKLELGNTAPENWYPYRVWRRSTRSK